jgi:adenosylhomocysteine nucleosidase
LTAVGIVAALEAEARILDSAHAHAHLPATLANGALLSVSGIGAAAAERAAVSLVAAGATALASWGMAGGLDPALLAGTILLPAQIISAEGLRFATAAKWREQLGASLTARRPVVGGALLTSPHPLQSAADKAAAFAATGALAVDMESLAVAAVAQRHELPFIAIRVIVDTAHDSLPGVITAATRSGHVRLGRLLGGLAAAPGEIFAVIRLAGRYRAAMRSLAIIAGSDSRGRFSLPTRSDAGLS